MSTRGPHYWIVSRAFSTVGWHICHVKGANLTTWVSFGFQVPSCQLEASGESVLRRRFPDRWSDAGPDWDLPLFLTCTVKLPLSTQWGGNQGSRKALRRQRFQPRWFRTNHWAQLESQRCAGAGPSGLALVDRAAPWAVGFGCSQTLHPGLTALLGGLVF